YRLVLVKFTGKEAVISSEESSVLKHGNADELLEYFNTVLNTLQYDHYIIKNEAVIQELLRFYLLAVKQPVCSQKHSAKGRSDLELEYDERRLVIELKYAEGEKAYTKALREAVEQLKSRDYGNTLPLKEQIYRVALVFDGSADKRCFVNASEL
ncbi:MAG: PD-(D/E)XK nuclease domain-containing protein, partial [Succinatimonas sp.]|nr:PD-(D/E)XK nuclease domain-containing protein [Succinatimonas sp.]